MKVFYITFRSVTFAQRGEGALMKKGIPCSLQRTPRWMEEQGCGYCLRLRLNQVEDAVAVLKINRVPFRRVYIQREGGAVEEVTHDLP